MKKSLWILALVILVISSLACGAFSGGAKPAATEADPNSSGGRATQPSESGNAAETTATAEGGNMAEATPTVVEKAPGGFDTEFPLPSDVSNFTTTPTGNSGINFQTKMSLTDAVAFYREAFTKAGYKERNILTVTSDTTFSMVFDGHANGKAIVIQGVDLGGGNTNLNIRFEDV